MMETPLWLHTPLNLTILYIVSGISIFQSYSRVSLASSVAKYKHQLSKYRHEQDKIEKNLKRHNEEMKLIVDGLDEYAILMLDPDGYISSWNLGAKRLFGYDETEVFGKHISLFFTPEDNSLHRPRTEILYAIEYGSAEGEYWQVKKGGELFWANVTMNPIWDDTGNLKGLVKIARDQTEKRLLEKRKDEFLGIASHELKTPLTSIKSYTQILKKHFNDQKDPVSCSYLNKMDTQLVRMTRLIRDVLDVSVISTGKIQFSTSTFDVSHLVRDVVKDISELHTTHPIRIVTNKSVSIEADRERIGLALSNIINNAIKYSPKGKEIIISLSTTGLELCITVKDYGIGIPPDVLPYIFEKFYRVNSPSRESFAGLGLGLYIAQQIISRHGGKITVASTQGAGTSFDIHLPLTAS